MGRILKSTEYEYKNCPIPGGGYVTGFLYHPAKEGILYARTDIGGAYRFDYVNNSWISISEHVTMPERDETFPIALAVDKDYPDRLYIAAGDGDKEQGILCISEDQGENYRYEVIPTPVHGNWAGRGAGLRLVVDPLDNNTLYFASQKGGLLKTTDMGKSWSRLDIPEDYMTFVYVSDDGNMMVAGTAGYTSRKSDSQRGHGLYVSYDKGATFEEAPLPDNRQIENAKMNGLVPSRYTCDGKYLYITMNSTGSFNYIVDMGYSCDTGNVIDGRIIRYDISNGKLENMTDISPKLNVSDYAKDSLGEAYLRHGFGGICFSPKKPGLLVASTMSRDYVDDDCIFRSFDYGESWEIVLQGLTTGEMVFNSEYMKPKYNGGRNFIHWLSDVKMNPFNPEEVWFNSGSGVFESTNFLAEKVAFADENKGLEETVHLNVYAPVSGEVKLVDILGDLGGFAFTDLDTPCDTSFSDSEGNRYITCINADLSDTDSNLGIIAARGNWRGKTKGGLIVTRDNYKTFDRLPMCFGLSDELDEAMSFIETPNVNPGWVAMSPSGNNIVWSIADGITLPIHLVIASKDGGKQFSRVVVKDINRQVVTTGLFKVFSDRVKDNVFYGFDSEGKFYVSTDGGQKFYEKPVSGYIPAVNFGIIDTRNKTEVRAEGGKSGVFYMALYENGLYKMKYDFNTEIFKVKRLTETGDKVFRVGLGVGHVGGDYLKENKAIYMCAEIDGEYGFFRSFDDGRTIELISNDKQHFGDINSIDGDKRVYGRFFIATGTRGVKYGQEKY